MTLFPPPSLTADDLRCIADALDLINVPAIANNPLIGDINVIQPDGKAVVGRFVREGSPSEDGGAWMGFRAHG